MRTLFAWFGVTAVLAIVGTAVWFGAQDRGIPAKQAWDATVVIDRILPAAKMITVEASTTQQLHIRDDFFDRKVFVGLVGREILVGQSATLNIGYDLFDWDAQEHVQVNLLTKTVSINMPEPKLLIVAPDTQSKSIYVQAGIFRNWDLTPQEAVKIDQSLHDKFVQAAEIEYLKDQAKRQLHSFLEDLFRPHGISVAVTFDHVPFQLSASSSTY